jgi:shikimate dehydrogenase
MPGCGKSTIGKILAERTGRVFADADAHIEALAGKTIPRIFAEDGEPVFRQWETETLNQLGQQSGLVIATGGGCVTQINNYPLLHQNGIIFWLKRDPEQLPTDGRPLSQSGKLAEMYAVRKPLYDAFSDTVVDNNGTTNDAVDTILKYLEGFQ